MFLVAYEAVINFNWYHISKEVSLLYGATSKVVWSALISWIIFVCHFGHAHRWLTQFLSWKGFRVASRLNLSALFVNLYLIRLRNATGRTTQHYSLRGLLLENGIPIIIYVYVVALINCALVEVPVANVLKKVFIPTRATPASFTKLQDSSKLTESERKGIMMNKQTNSGQI